MKIGIIGSGNIGATTARLFVNAEHQVAISNSCGPQSLTSLVASIGADAKATTVQAALAFGDVILCNTMEEDRRVTIITIRIA